MMETSGHNNMCRCCASEGAFKDIKSTYHWMGEEEIYADMLKECFDISLNVSEHGEDGGICEVCITQLRNAINFKKQVQHTEEQFKKHLQNKAMFRPHIVKVEVVAGDEDSDGDNIGSGDDTFSGAEFEVPIKTENDDPKPKKRSKGMAASTRSKQSKTTTDDGETSTKHSTRSRKQIITITKERKVKKKRVIEIKSDDSKIPIHLKKKTEVDKHIHNIRTILCHSNATPIGKYAGIGYVCSFCTQEYETPAELKTHTINNHKDARSSFMEDRPLYNFIVKLDITNLKCDICQADVDTLEHIVDHLQTVHNKFFHLGLKSYVLPFRFDNNTSVSSSSCVICNNNYNNFKVLLEHMNSHYRNYICEICDSGFVNRKTLLTHTYRHRTGVFNCSYCQKVFDTRVKLKQHEKAVHICMNKRNKCGYCGEKFTDYLKKNFHEVLVHGAKPRVLKCQACDKTFDNQRSLTFHTKTYHLLEKSTK